MHELRVASREEEEPRGGGGGYWGGGSEVKPPFEYLSFVFSASSFRAQADLVLTDAQVRREGKREGEGESERQ